MYVLCTYLCAHVYSIYLCTTLLLLRELYTTYYRYGRTLLLVHECIDTEYMYTTGTGTGKHGKWDEMG